MIRSVSDMEKGIIEREIQGPIPWFGRSLTWRKNLYGGKSRDRSQALVGLSHGKRIYREGIPGTDPMIQSVSDMQKGFIQRKIQGPTPWFGRSLTWRKD
jgi:hypothetical protein